MCKNNHSTCCTNKLIHLSCEQKQNKNKKTTYRQSDTWWRSLCQYYYELGRCRSLHQFWWRLLRPTQHHAKYRLELSGVLVWWLSWICCRLWSQTFAVGLLNSCPLQWCWVLFSISTTWFSWMFHWIVQSKEWWRHAQKWLFGFWSHLCRWCKGEFVRWLCSREKQFKYMNKVVMGGVISFSSLIFASIRFSKTCEIELKQRIGKDGLNTVNIQFVLTDG